MPFRRFLADSHAMIRIRAAEQLRRVQACQLAHGGDGTAAAIARLKAAAGLEG